MGCLRITFYLDFYGRWFKAPEKFRLLSDLTNATCASHIKLKLGFLEYKRVSQYIIIMNFDTDMHSEDWKFSTQMPMID